MIRLSRKTQNFDEIPSFCYSEGIFTSVNFFQMTNTKIERASESSDAALHEMKFKVAKALELVRKHSKICVLALLASNSAAFADTSSNNDSVLLASVSGSEATDTKGVINYSQLSATEIQQYILALQNKIDGLKKRRLSKLSDAEFDSLIAYQDELKTLRDYEQHIQKEAITQKKEAVRANFEEINNIIKGGG